MEGTALIIIVAMCIMIGMYYGLGNNVEVSSRMLTRELIDAERMQKERIKGRLSKAAANHNEDEWKATAAYLDKIDNLDI